MRRVGSASPKPILNELIDAGADCVTLGNHAFDQKDTLVYIDRHDRLVRPLNFPKGTPGKGATMLKAKNGADVLVINAMGRVFMTDLDCPFRAIDNEITACSLKTGRGRDLRRFPRRGDKRKAGAGLVPGWPRLRRGWHAHTYANQRSPGSASGTAYMSDAGMCGDYNSVLGMESDEPINRFLTKIPRGRFEPSSGPGTLSGFALEIDDKTGLTTKCAAFRQGPHLEETMPAFWTTT